MTKVQYVGNTRRGTLTPRKMWSPRETMDVAADVAEELVRDPNFRLVRPRKKKQKK